MDDDATIGALLFHAFGEVPEALDRLRAGAKRLIEVQDD